MRVIGIDAGSTSVCGVLLNTATGLVEEVVSKEHEASLSPAHDRQDADRILETVRRIVSLLTGRAIAADRRTPAAIGLTGQVHGIVYVDAHGLATGPLYTWQDTRARAARDGRAGSETWVDWARRLTGYRLPAGYGLLTHCVNAREGLVPREASRLASILGYLAMRLADEREPRVDPTDAHSLGLFSVERGEFDHEALDRLAIPPEILPKVERAGTRVGTTPEAIPVILAIGDNQAGVVGAVRAPEESILLNVGTSAQMSVYVPRPAASRPRSDGASGALLADGWLGDVEVRPFPGGGRLLTGASLSGGSAYRMLEDLFREVCVRFAGVDPGRLLDDMSAIAYDGLDDRARLRVRTSFIGTRGDPDAAGSIEAIRRGNFTVDRLVEGFLAGIADELHAYWRSLPAWVRDGRDRIVAVGNGLRRNPLLRRIVADRFGLPVEVPSTVEEAALGAAVAAGAGVGLYRGYAGDDRPIEYEDDERVRGRLREESQEDDG